MAVGPRDRALRRARRCYDHLAGEVAVGLVDGFSAAGELRLDGGVAVLTKTGRARLARLGVAGEGVACRPCLDWSERRPHLAGPLGAALLDALLARRWLRPGEGRALAVTTSGEAGLNRLFR